MEIVLGIESIVEVLKSIEITLLFIFIALLSLCGITAVRKEE